VPRFYQESPGERKMIGFVEGERNKFYRKMQKTKAYLR